MIDRFRRFSLSKPAWLVVLLLVLWIPLASIQSLIAERGDARQQATAELAQTYSGEQVVRGPVLLVPVTERWTEDERQEHGATRFGVPRVDTYWHAVFPERLGYAGEMTPDQRYRGIFKVLFYRYQGQVRGEFAPFDARVLQPRRPDARLDLGVPVLAISVSDVRGLQGMPVADVAGERLRFVGQLADAGSLRGIQAPLSGAALTAWRTGQRLSLAMDLDLLGQQRLAIAPLAEDTTAELRSSWADPSFGGRFLATERRVGDTGFEARWRVSTLATDARAQFQQRLATAAPIVEPEDSFDVRLVEPLDVYALSGRSIKFGILFVALVLAAVFMFEVFRRLQLHPVQYGMVGASLALFFLMMLALSEKMRFGLAYGVAAGASVLLLAVYFSAVLRARRHGVGVAGFVLVLYGVLYGLLLSESNALLLGACLLFAMLASLMLLTRRVDWYALGAADEDAQP
jgi:inner membrane protein